MKVSFVGEEMVRWNSTQRIISFEFADDSFDRGAAIVKAPEVQRFQCEIGDEYLVEIFALLEQGKLVGGLFVLGTAHHDEAIRFCPTLRLITKFGGIEAFALPDITQRRKLLFEASGELGGDDKASSLAF